MRGFIVRSPESPRRSNLDTSLDGVSKAHAADRSIPKKFLSRRLARANLYFHEFTRDKLKGTANLGRKGRFDEFRLEQVFWKRDTVLAFSGGEG